MAIYVQLRGDLPPVFVPVIPADTVGEVLGDAAGILRKDPEQSHLMFGDTVLDDLEKPLSEYGVGAEDILVLVAEAG